MTAISKTTIKTQTRRSKNGPAANPPRVKRAAKRAASNPADAGGAPTAATLSEANKAPAATPPVAKPTANPRPGGKLGLVVALLRRPQGATVFQMSEATDWLPHSVRGAIAGALKKKHGLAVVSEPAEGGRVYRLPPEQSVSA